MMRDGTPEQLARVTQAFLKMKKFDLELLRHEAKLIHLRTVGSLLEFLTHPTIEFKSLLIDD